VALAGDAATLGQGRQRLTLAHRSAEFGATADPVTPPFRPLNQFPPRLFAARLAMSYH